MGQGFYTVEPSPCSSPTPEQGMHNQRDGDAELTWPKKRKGSRKVSPRHIQDWKPSVGRKGRQ